jgi:DNA repair protein RadA/Sms
MWNSFIEEQIPSHPKHSSARPNSSNKPVSINAVVTQKEERFQTGIDEFDRVLGGGIVPGSAMLVGGAPGMGKSTLLLQICAALASKGKKILYISGEESQGQIKLRADRLSIKSDHYFLLTETNAESIQQILKSEKPDIAVVDSIQTVSSQELESLPGNVSQVRYCGHLLTSIAKEENLPLFLVGHVTKEGSLAGPRVLEHLVDALLLLEGDDQHQYRLLRAVKNRFGSTNEVGIFEMTETGMQEVKNPSRYLLSQKQENASGTVITVSIEGTRPLLVEVQALVTPTSYQIPQRTATGVDARRLSIILAVLEKRMGLRFGSQDVFANAAGGLRLTEPGADLAVAAALVSSQREKIIDAKTVVVGEVGLAGEIRGVSQIDKRLSEVQRLGFKNVILPQNSLKGLNRDHGLQLKGFRTVHEAISYLIQ